MPFAICVKSGLGWVGGQEADPAQKKPHHWRVTGPFNPRGDYLRAKD